MAHRCTKCDNLVENGSKELLTGCPNCGNQSWELIDHQEMSETTETDNDGFINADEVDTPTSIGILSGRSETSSSNNNSYETIREKQEIEENLNSQYEGIKIVDGEWKINLAELYRGHQYIVKIGENGSYEISEVESEG